MAVVRKYDLSSGAAVARWATPLEGARFLALGVKDEARLYVSARSRIVELDAGTGEMVHVWVDQGVGRRLQDTEDAAGNAALSACHPLSIAAHSRLTVPVPTNRASTSQPGASISKPSAAKLPEHVL